MTGLKYQLKSIQRDKMCILTFVLPVIVAIAINLLSGFSFQSISETSFGVLQNNISNDVTEWLHSKGNVVEYTELDKLRAGVNDPSTQIIGVLQAGNTIQTFLSGDELEVNKVIADTLPKIYENHSEQSISNRTIVPVMADNEGLKSLLIVITLVTAMFMGCTFNAMNIISEKEDGIEFINQVLPMTAKYYIIQKTLLGFIGGTISTIITALICLRLKLALIFPFLLIILISAYISALIGLFIGYFSNGLMIGIVYIKIIMIFFLAPPILFYLTLPDSSIIFKLSYLLPSIGTFYGVMDLLNGKFNKLWIPITALLFHALLWSIIYRLIYIKKK